MNRFLSLFLLMFPVLLFAENAVVSGIIKVDVTVKVLSAEGEDLWSIDLSKYTISNRTVSLELQGFDGELVAEMTPVVIDEKSMLLKTTCIVRALESGRLITESSKELLAEFNDEIIFYPLGSRVDTPEVIIIMYISKHNGAYN